MPKNIVILGSTGSIGVNALNVVREMPEDFRVAGLAVHSNVNGLLKQAKEFKPDMLAVFDAEAAKGLKPSQMGVRSLPPGVEGLCEMVSEKSVDVVLTSLVGGVGFAPLLAALKAGKTVALANKEPMVMAGEQFMIEAERWGGKILPVDSEPSAIFQCFGSRELPKGGLRGYGKTARRVILTASGGAFKNYKGDLADVTAEQALKHPTWKMGQKITLDCATLMNKGFEAIEIKNLFALSLDQIEIVIHAQSIIHGAVEFSDGSMIAQMSPPDMRLPIQYAMTWPERTKRVVESLDLFKTGELTFAKPDFKRFRCLDLALEACRAGGGMPAVLSAADEVAVDSFVAGKIRFTDIPRVIETTMKAHQVQGHLPSFAEVAEIDQWAREKAAEMVEALGAPA